MSTRHRCPGCGTEKTFSRYIDTATGEHIHPNVGRCNRESNCGYHYTPKQYFQANKILPDTSTIYRPRPVTPPRRPASFIPVEVFKASLNPTAFEANHFVIFLVDLFGAEVASELVSRYFIATSKHWTGATVFWQIDTKGKVRTGKIMLYNPATGKRVKEPFSHIYWVHKAIQQPEFELRQCLFGEHLLIDKAKPVAIVESEKTAVIASVYLPQFIWLAVGSLTNLNAERCNILKGRTVTLFPDLKGFEKWNSKAKELSHLAIFTVSDLLERKATEAERELGLDIADYLLRYDYKAFALPVPKATDTLLVVEVKSFDQSKPDHGKPKPKAERWDITGLQNYFTGIELPAGQIRLDNWTTIINCQQFIESHLSTLRGNNGNVTYLPYLNRLQGLRQILTANLN